MNIYNYTCITHIHSFISCSGYLCLLAFCSLTSHSYADDVQTYKHTLLSIRGCFFIPYFVSSQDAFNTTDVTQSLGEAGVFLAYIPLLFIETRLCYWAFVSSDFRLTKGLPLFKVTLRIDACNRTRLTNGDGGYTG